MLKPCESRFFVSVRAKQETGKGVCAMTQSSSSQFCQFYFRSALRHRVQRYSVGPNLGAVPVAAFNGDKRRLHRGR